MAGMLGVIVLATAVPVVSAESLWLMGGGIIGAIVRALWTRGQKNLGLETVHDAFIGLLIGALWTVEIPMIGGIWPPFEFSVNASYVQRALLVSVFVLVAVEGIKQCLVRWGQGYLSKLGGPELQKKDEPVDPKP